MKSKKIKKVINQSIKELHEIKVLESNNSFQNLLFTEPTKEIKKKTRNMIFRLLKLRDTLNMSVDKDHIYISSENGFNLNYNSNSSDYLSLDIMKDIGYLLHWKDKKFAFKDENLYYEVLEKSKKVFKELNDSNFEELYSLILKESGLSRDSNLDDLLS
jgi:hypothetical protein